uniref:Uncharacterized protein n=1 Tax=Mimivirus LCMiAC01 TaxID=2506608 RepID=A0A481YZT6_9VIRU|nr:MAG: hypothetical protein LCMiAC01_04100 [Mimivirus LCMiAC01]
MLLLFAIVSTVLASGCWIEYAAILPAQWKTTPLVTIDTNYSRVFNACDMATGGMYEIGYEINNIDTVYVRIYYELSQVINGSYVRKGEVCNGSCTSGNIYICCKDFNHKYIRVTVENLKNSSNSSVVLQSLSIRYAQEWATAASLVGFMIVCVLSGVLLLLCFGCICGCVLCVMRKKYI